MNMVPKVFVSFRTVSMPSTTRSRSVSEKVTAAVEFPVAVKLKFSNLNTNVKLTEILPSRSVLAFTLVT